MKVFISYSVRDTELVTLLHEDLTRLGHTVWRDTDISGGQEWWTEICHQISECEIFVFAISTQSVRSPYCVAELEYASALGRTILPIDVDSVSPELAPPVIRSIQHVSYKERTPEAAISLAKALASMNVSKHESNERAPVPPKVPLEDVTSLRDAIMSPELSISQQQDLIARLRDEFNVSDDVVIELARTLRSRVPSSSPLAMELDAIIDKGTLTAENRMSGRILVKALLGHVRKSRLTPILGSGLMDKMTGSRGQLARKWSQKFEFPLSTYLRDDLPEVAQFVKVMAGDIALRDSYRDHLEDELRALLEKGRAPLPPLSDIDGLFTEAWEQHSATATDPHQILARLPCPVYVTAHPAQLMETALLREGKNPRSEICQWRTTTNDLPEVSLDSPSRDNYVPSPESPLVFHVFGRLDIPDSLVLTEDDFFDFLVRVTEDRTLIPTCVRRALADSALLLLGLQLDDWEFRILWRAVIQQEGSGRLSRYKNVAAQVDLAEAVVSPAGARAYLNNYFGKVSVPSLDIFWGSVEEFVSTLESEIRAST